MNFIAKICSYVLGFRGIKIILVATFLIAFVHSPSQSQQWLVSVDVVTEDIQANNIYISANTLKFYSISDSMYYEMPLSDMTSIQWDEGQEAVISLNKINLDTLSGIFTGLSDTHVFFQLPGESTPRQFSRKNVFGIFSSKENLDEMTQKYLNDFMSAVRISKPDYYVVLTGNGNKYQVSNFRYNNGRLDFVHDGRNQFAEIKSIKANVNGEILSFVSSRTFFVNNEGKFFEVKIDNIEGNSISYRMNLGPEPDMLLVSSKQDNNGIFFRNYSSRKHGIKPLYNSNLTGTNRGNSQNLVVRFDINAGLGYLVGRTVDGISADEKNYLDGLRRGSVVDVNVLYLTGVNNLGVGISYNQFNTSNSISGVMEDNITSRFYALTTAVLIPRQSNKGFFDLNFSLGYFSLINKGKIKTTAMTIKGNTIAMRMGAGIEKFLSPRVSLGLKVALLSGSISEFEVNGKNVKPETKDNISRFEGLAGIKFYL